MADYDAKELPIKLADMSKQPEPKFRGNPITPERYWSKEWMDREWDTVWTKTWQIACLETELNEKGAYTTTSLGRERILCVRGDDDKIRVFYNVCQHRGLELMKDECGHAKRLVCPYHAWSYDLKGTLKSVPDEADFAESPCGKLNLIEMKSEVWAGFVWYNMDDGCVPLKEYLGPIADQIDTYPMQEFRRTHWVTVEGDWNWKLVQDNFSESYHVPFVHPGAKYVLEYGRQGCQFDHYPQGHCRMLMPGGGPALAVKGGEKETLERMAGELEFWELDPEDYKGGNIRNIRIDLQRAKRRLGEAKGYDYSSYHDDQLTDNWHYTIFPNLSFSLKPESNIWLRARPHPADPEKCLFDMWFMVLFAKGQTEYFSYVMNDTISTEAEVPHMQGTVDEVTTGPAIDEDLEIWPQQQRGLHSRGYKRDYLAGQESRMLYFHETLEDWMARE